MHPWLIKHTQDAILFIDESGLIMDGSKIALEWVGISTLQSNVNDTVLQLDEIVQSAVNGSTFRTKTKADVEVQVYASYVEDYKLYMVLLFPLSIHSITGKLKDHLNKIYMHSQEGVVLFDKHHILDCDLSFARLFGYEMEEIKKQSLFDLLMDNAPVSNSFMFSTDSSIQLVGKKKDGTPLYIELIVQDFPVRNQMIQCAFVRDITEVYNNEKRMEFITYYDELTNLPNYHYFSKILTESIHYASEHNERIAIYFIDIDYFKQINDTLGYEFGDRFLRAVGDRLRTLLSPSMFLARMNGDEFILLHRLFHQKQKDRNIADHLLKAFEAPIELDGHEIYISVSVGVSFYPDHGTSPNDLIKYADAAMYVSKNIQRNHFQVFDPSISDRFKQALTMETDLRKALKERQFELHYQPQKEMNSGRVVGMEALLRWKHPKIGYIPPDTFIPLAERSGLIMEIGEWVLREACMQNKRWQEQGFSPVVVGVNMSVKQFYQKNLVAQVAQILQETGLEAKYLELEITETIAMAHEEFILETLRGLRNIGVQVSIDDFGTGYSSLKYLSIFPLTKLKIDRIFLDGKQKQNLAIVKSIIHLSHSLQMKVIAEGVETEEQVTFLKQQDCDEIQGYFFSKPLPVDQVTHLLCELQ
ncbi:GGDEF and EAL domain-containing protein [Radiobacillus deserti]|nr:GGDEF and EAL domain-containing protein [Radiobacillus deserti]